MHYTSLATLYSIIEKQIEWTSRHEQSTGPPRGVAPQETSSEVDILPELGPCFRLYDSAHVNDPQEGRYFTRHVPEEHKWLEQFDTHRAYIGSFILPRTTTDDAGDNLVFWRTYGREGEGCSISLAIPRNKLRQVKYRPQDVRASWELLAPALARLRPLLSWGERLDVDARHHFREALAHMIWTSLGPIRYLYKSKAYKYERECRVVLAQSNNDATQDSIDFRFQSTGRGGLIRHFVEDSDLPITSMFSSGTSIYIGPCCRNQARLDPFHHHTSKARRFGRAGKAVEDQVPTSFLKRCQTRCQTDRCVRGILAKYGGASLSPRARRARKEQYGWHC